MTTIITSCAVILAISAIVVLWRVERGPSILDRMVALDLLTSIVLAAVGLMIAATGRTDLVPILVVLAIVGFIGSTTVARFAAQVSADNKRILSTAEVNAMLAEEAAAPIPDNEDDIAAVHDPDALDAAATDGEGEQR